MRKRPAGTPYPTPVTIRDVRARCNGVQVHCLRCARMIVLGLDRFADDTVIADLAKRRRFRCARCGGSWVETRPNYVMTNGRRAWYGLTRTTNPDRP